MEPLGRGRSSICRKEIVRSAHGLWKVRDVSSTMSETPTETTSTQAAESDLEMSASGSCAFSQSLPNTPDRRLKREFQLLMKPPFFMNLEHDSERTDDLICGRCCTCLHTLVCSENQPENLIKHLKIDHPVLYDQFLAKYQAKTEASTASPDGIPYIDLNDEEEEDIINLDLNPDDEVAGQRNDPLENVNDVTVVSDDEDFIVELPVNDHDANDIIELSGGSDDEYDIHDVKDIKADLSDMNSSYASSVQESLISTAAMQQINELLNEKLSGFVTRMDFNAMAQNLANQSGSKRKRKYETDSEVAAELKSLKQKYRKLHSAIGAATQGKAQLQKEIEDMDKRLHTRDVMFYNVRIDPDQDPSGAVADILMSIFQLNESVFSNVSVVKEQGYGNKYMLLVKFTTDHVAQHVLRNSFLLKNTGVFVETRMSVHVQRRKQKLMRIRNELRRRDQGLRITVRGNLMVVCGKQFRWDDTEGLCLCDPSLSEDPTMSAADYLKSITEVNISDFLKELNDCILELE